MTAAEADGESISLLDLVRENARKFDEICCAGLAVTERCRTAMQLHVERTLSEMGPEGLAKFAETLFPVEPYKPPRMLWRIRRQLMLHLGIIDKLPCPKAVLPPRSPSHRDKKHARRRALTSVHAGLDPPSAQTQEERLFQQPLIRKDIGKFDGDTLSPPRVGRKPFCGGKP